MQKNKPFISTFFFRSFILSEKLFPIFIAAPNNFFSNTVLSLETCSFCIFSRFQNLEGLLNETQKYEATFHDKS